MDYIKNPMEIENTSMKIIEGEMGEHNFTKEELSIIKRTIHTTADFEYKDLVEISKGAIIKWKGYLLCKFRRST